MTHTDEASILGLEGKVALITGGGAGIGRATAELFAKAGMRIAIAEIDAKRAEDARSALEAAGAEVLAVTADVTRRGGRRTGVRRIEATLRPAGRAGQQCR